jgi:hypothetical protein
VSEQNISPALDSFIATRERRISKAFGYSRTSVRESFERLLAGQVVRVGGRATCGGKVDPSWVEFVAWQEIIRKAATAGLRVEVTPVKHGNGWATKAGGFWDENDYQLLVPA